MKHCQNNSCELVYNVNKHIENQKYFGNQDPCCIIFDNIKIQQEKKKNKNITYSFEPIAMLLYTIYYGSSFDNNINTENDVINLQNTSDVSNLTITLTFNPLNYKYLVYPSTLEDTNLTFTDSTSGILIPIINLGTVLIGIVEYKIVRTFYPTIEPLTVTITV